MKPVVDGYIMVSPERNEEGDAADGGRDARDCRRGRRFVGGGGIDWKSGPAADHRDRLRRQCGSEEILRDYRFVSLGKGRLPFIAFGGRRKQIATKNHDPSER